MIVPPSGEPMKKHKSNDMRAGKDETRTIYVRYCDAAIDALNAQYEMTKVIGHNASAGGVREAILRDFLAAHLPELASAVSGVIFDSTGTRSRQQDIVFVLKTFPRLPFANGCDLIYVEGVVATIEVKTRIGPADWATIGNNLASVRALTPTGNPVLTMGDLDWDGTQVFSAIVIYDGAPLQSVAKSLGKLPIEGWPHVYLDLKRGMLVQNTGVLLPQDSSDAFIVVNDPGLAFARFLVFLTKITGWTVIRGAEWNAYLGVLPARHPGAS
jgi:hypothetical protein